MTNISLKGTGKSNTSNSSIQPVTSLEWPFNCLMIEGGSVTVHTVKVPSDAPYASRSELICPNFKTVTAIKLIGISPYKSLEVASGVSLY